MIRIIIFVGGRLSNGGIIGLRLTDEQPPLYVHDSQIELMNRDNKALVIPEGTPESQLGILINKFTRGQIETPPVTRRERSKRIVSESNYSDDPIIANHDCLSIV